MAPWECPARWHLSLGVLGAVPCTVLQWHPAKVRPLGLHPGPCREGVPSPCPAQPRSQALGPGPEGQDPRQPSWAFGTIWVQSKFIKTSKRARLR